jgi:hypothetical protein
LPHQNTETWLSVIDRSSGRQWCGNPERVRA